MIILEKFITALIVVVLVDWLGQRFQNRSMTVKEMGVFVAGFTVLTLALNYSQVLALFNDA